MPWASLVGGEAAGQPDDAGLGGGIGEVLGQAEHPRGGRHDDAAVALRDHQGPGRPGGVERARDVDGQVSLQVIQVGVRQAGPAR